MAVNPAHYDSVVIRRLNTDDSVAWRTLTARRRRATPAGTFGDQALPDDQVDVAHLTVAPAHGSTFGVEIDGRMVGCARVTCARANAWMLSTVYLDTEFRGRGLGRTLLSATLAAVPPAAVTELWVASTNPAAQTLYRGLGFSITTKTWAPDPTAWVHMRLSRRP